MAEGCVGREMRDSVSPTSAGVAMPFVLAVADNMLEDVVITDS